LTLQRVMTTALKSSDCNEWPPLSAEEIEVSKSAVPLWKVVGDSPPKLSREFKTKNFQCALDFINHAGKVAEERGHHPDLHIEGWNGVRVVIYSHGTNSLTQNDFNLAEAIDKDFSVAYNKKWLSENPHVQP
jgi:4a-hydroxytetrahydrobiopterin dehydratase